MISGIYSIRKIQQMIQWIHFLIIIMFVLAECEAHAHNTLNNVCAQHWYGNDKSHVPYYPGQLRRTQHNDSVCSSPNWWCQQQRYISHRIFICEWIYRRLILDHHVNFGAHKYECTFCVNIEEVGIISIWRYWTVDNRFAQYTKPIKLTVNLLKNYPTIQYTGLYWNLCNCSFINGTYVLCMQSTNTKISFLHSENNNGVTLHDSDLLYDFIILLF